MYRRNRILFHINRWYSNSILVQSQSPNPIVAASMFFKSCNCNSSIATRVGFAVRVLDTFAFFFFLCAFKIIFLLNSMLAWLMKTPLAIKTIEKWSYDYIKMDCEEGKCYGVLAVRTIFCTTCQP
jgi:serine incorporator 1/3